MIRGIVHDILALCVIVIALSQTLGSTQEASHAD